MVSVAKIDGRPGKVQSRGRFWGHGGGHVPQAAAAPGSDLDQVLAGRIGACRQVVVHCPGPPLKLRLVEGSELFAFGVTGLVAVVHEPPIRVGQELGEELVGKLPQAHAKFRNAHNAKE